MSHIVYLSNARLPTEKAHGFQVMKMCEGMAALGHQVELLHPRRRQSDATLSETDPFAYYGVDPTFRVSTVANWDVVRLEHWLPTLPFRALLATHGLAWGLLGARRAVQLGPDLIYTRSAPLAYWVARLGWPCVFEAHGPPRRRMAFLIRNLSRRSCTRAVFALTGPTAAELRAVGVPPGKLELLPDAVDPAPFADLPVRKRAREQLGLPAGRAIVGYVGRFETMGEDKGIPDLIRAIAVPELRREDPLLLCVGGPISRVPAYLELANSLDLPASSVRFVDRVPNSEVPTWLAAIDVAVLPAPEVALGAKARRTARDHYPNATSPLKLFEYMAAGLPIVAAELPGIREVLDDGENALLVPLGDPESLGHRVSQMLRDPAAAQALGERARAEAAQYTWRRRAERALRSALGADGRGSQPPGLGPEPE